MFGEIRSGRHPHEVGLLIIMFLLGSIGLLFFSKLANAPVKSLPYPFGHVLFAGLILGSGVTLGGVFWRNIAGALAERIGLFSLTLHAAAYTYAIIAVSGLRGVNLVGFMVYIIGANIWRMRQIGREIKQMEALREQNAREHAAVRDLLQIPPEEP